MKKFSFLISTVLMLSLLVGCAGNEPASITTSETNMIATIVAGTLSAIPTDILTPVPSTAVSLAPMDISVSDEWAWHNIDLYNLKVNLPNGWSLSEVNRRQEPTPMYGHDCADYIISNPDGTEKITLEPVCTVTGGIHSYCPIDTVVMAKHNDDLVHYFTNFPDQRDITGRYYDQDKSAYIYTEIEMYSNSMVSNLDTPSVEMFCADPRILIFEEQGFIFTMFQYLGNGTNIDQILTTADKIVLSISNQ